MKRALESKMLLLYLPSQEKTVKGTQTEKKKKMILYRLALPHTLQPGGKKEKRKKIRKPRTRIDLSKD